MKKLLSLLSSIIFSLTLIANTGTIKGKATDKTSGEPLPFANVILFQNNAQVAGTMTDFEGIYAFNNLTPGNYTIQCSYVGYQPLKLENIEVTVGKITFADIKFSQGVSIDAFEVIEYEVPLISKDQTSSGGTVTFENISRMSSRSATDIAATVGGVQVNNDGTYNIRGSRSGSTDTYIDGIRVRGSASAPRYKYQHHNQKKRKVQEKYKFSDEKYASRVDNTFVKVKRKPLSTFSIDVDKASYSITRKYINQHGMLPPKDAVKVEEMINYFSYDYDQPENGEPFKVSTTYTDCPWNEKSALVHIGIQGKDIPQDNIPKSNLVFLIDVSGSMDSYDKLPLVQKSLSMLVDKMRSNDKISIVTYANGASIVLNSASGNKKDKIKEAIDKLQAAGGTAGADGIQKAYQLAKKNFIANGNNRVILATDGDFNIGISDDNELKKFIEGKRDDGIFLSVLGVGSGNIKDSKMEKLADNGNGNYHYIDNILEGKKVLINEFGGTLFTIAKDVKIQIEFNPNFVGEYKLIGYENRLLADKDFNDDKKDAGEIGSGHTVTAIYEIVSKEQTSKDNLIDELKYQEDAPTSNSFNNELLTLKIRYKEPKENTSKLITHIVTNKLQKWELTNNNVQFSVAVAQFGMLLRNNIKGTNYKDIVALAKQAKGKDEEGYRAEFFKLVESAELLSMND